MVRSLAITCSLALVFSITARADIAGKAVGVTDGDTITVMDASTTRHKVRLAGIDAPERGQPGGFRFAAAVVAAFFLAAPAVFADDFARDTLAPAAAFAWVRPTMAK